MSSEVAGHGAGPGKSIAGKALALLPNALLIALVVVLTWLNTVTQIGPFVRLEQGAFRGVVDHQHDLEAFRGIRYALPPLGDLRFRRPKMVWDAPLPDRLDPHNRTSSDGVFDASFYGPSCGQYVPPAFMAYRPPLPEGRVQQASSEDCLSVNVFRPATIHKRLPVMIWIYGGAWLMGADFPYEPTNLVRRSILNGKPIIVVTFNYRVGVYGFASGPSIAEEAEKGNADLNVGLHDQRGALRWVKRNIAQFGGDPNSITIAGESSGGQSISYHLLADGGDEKGENLFHRAIMQSGGSSMALTPPTASRHLLHWRAFLAPTTCARFAASADQIRCLRELPEVALSQANTRAKMYVLGVHQAASWRSPTFFPFWPTFDKDFITKSPFELWQEGKYKDVPLLMGNVLDEGTAFTPHDLHNETVTRAWMKRAVVVKDDLTPADHRHVLRSILKAWPDDPAVGSPFRPELTGGHSDDRYFGEENQFKRAAAAIGDIIFQAPRRYQLRQHALHHAAGRKRSAAWSYLLSEPGPGGQAYTGVSHGTDNDLLFRPMAQYVFLRPPVDYRKPGSRWATVAENLMDAWINFVNQGHPNGGKKVPRWPYYAAQGVPKRSRPHLTLQFQAYNNTLITDDYREEAITKTLIEDETVRRALAY